MMVRQTAAFIAADADVITVLPQAGRTADGAGGYIETPGVPFERTVRLIPQSDKIPVNASWEGSREAVEYVLLDVPEAALLLLKDDRFSWRGQTWKISQIHDKPDYEFKADVILDVG